MDQIYEELDKNDELSSNVNAIRLFTNAMPVFSDEQLTYFMHMLLARAKNVENKSEKYDERIAIKDELLELGYAEMVKNWNL